MCMCTYMLACMHTYIGGPLQGTSNSPIMLLPKSLMRTGKLLLRRCPSASHIGPRQELS